MSEVLHIHDSARLPASVHTTEAISNFGQTVLSHPSESSDLTPSDYHRFEPLRKSLQGHYYTNDEALQNALCQWMQRKESNFY